MAARDNHGIAIDVGIERNGHDHTVLFVKDVLLAEVAKHAFAHTGPVIAVVTARSRVAIIFLFFAFLWCDVMHILVFLASCSSSFASFPRRRESRYVPF